MRNKLESYYNLFQENNLVYEPLILTCDSFEQIDNLKKLASDLTINYIDNISLQLTDLFRSHPPSSSASSEDIERKVFKHLNKKGAPYGNWIYYPWKNTIIRLLTPQDFFSLRTNRNRNKITELEQRKLKSKKVGIIGLSTGHECALLLMQELGCQEIRIADFDCLDISNLNRLRTSLLNIGIPKFVITARELYELDPYIEVTVFPQGINESNMETFLGSDSTTLDILIEQCDDLYIKLLSRKFAKERKIPVVMDTNDRGLLDIERFDYESDYDILHGLVHNIDISTREAFEKANKMDVIYTILGGKDSISHRLHESLQLLGTKNLSGFPQLASEVRLGASLACYSTKQIFLDSSIKSQRFYLDLEELISH